MAVTTAANRSTMATWWRRISLLKESPVGMTGAFIILFWIAVAILAPLLSPFDPFESDYEMLADLAPSSKHWFGLDENGRDVLSRVIWGSRTVLTVAPLAVAVAYFIGCSLGLLAGYYKGWVDTLMTRITNIILSIPPIVLFIIFITVFGPSVGNIIIAVTLTAAPQVSRLVRGITLELHERDFVAAAKMRGENAVYIMVVEILPNAGSSKESAPAGSWWNIPMMHGRSGNTRPCRSCILRRSPGEHTSHGCYRRGRKPFGSGSGKADRGRGI